VLAQLVHSPADLAHRQMHWRRRAPGPEGLTLHVVEQSVGIDPVGLGTHQAGALIVVGHPGVEHHHRPAGAGQFERGRQVVQPGGLHAHPRGFGSSLHNRACPEAVFSSVQWSRRPPTQAATSSVAPDTSMPAKLS